MANLTPAEKELPDHGFAAMIARTEQNNEDELKQFKDKIKGLMEQVLKACDGGQLGGR